MESYPRSHLRAVLFLAGILGLVILSLPDSNPQETTQQPISLALTPPAVIETPAAENYEPEIDWKEVTIRQGDNLSLIFKRLGLSAQSLHDILQAGPETSILRRISPGQFIYFNLSETGELVSLKYQKNAFEHLIADWTPTGFIARLEATEPEVILAYRTARITSDEPSLYHAGKGAGLSDNIIMKMSNIFQWDISFALDLREGDTFTLIYEELYSQGEKVKEGEILAAYFKNMGEEHSAVLFTNRDGIKSYYAPDGRSLKKPFLRDPVHFSYVSSSFNLRRKHPIFNRNMPHRGIDYAARTGTPVVASGDGTVTIARQNNASGKYIVIQHGEQYTTKYLHLSGFANGVRPGKSVSQGQVIGYVGSTGWATGPHLHYEFLVNGVHHNPRTVDLPHAVPIKAADLDYFRVQTGPMLVRLASIAGTSNLAAVAGDQDNPG